MKNWEYRIIEITVESSEPTNVEKASKRMKNISQEFLKKEFPDQYKHNQSSNFSLQLQRLINIYGKRGWEHYYQGQFGNKILFYFKREITTEESYLNAPLTPKEESIVQKLDDLQKP
tara:strand:- start:417 stop:767 length:351 start_codon:yes stop_codon:yes gene_type:complete